MKIRRVFYLIASLSTVALSQTARVPAFEKLDVHLSPSVTYPVVRGPFFGGNRFEMRFASMLDLITTAYNIDSEKVFGGPTWLEMDRFDILATMPPETNAEARRQMLQTSLADRFQLAVHHDRKLMPALSLSANKNTKLKEAAEGNPSSCTYTVENPPNPPAGGGPIPLPVINYTCRNTTMEKFAASLPSMAGAGPYLGRLPVIDQTDLKGSFDFDFRFTAKLPAAIPTTGEPIPLFDAIERQLGLKVKPTTAPAPVLVVDHVNRQPTPNSPDVLKAFPPSPMEFEVASLKPSAPEANGGRGGWRPEIRNGRVFLPRVTIRNLIEAGWNIEGDDLVAGAPKWIDEDHYDILAKVPEGVAVTDPSQPRGAPLNLDAVRPMIRSLLRERFQLAAHMEDRPVDAYTLVTAKPKLKKADPESRTRWQEGATPSAKGKSLNTSLGRLVTCQNMTMAELAQNLPNMAPGYLHTNVLDATGLDGGWDFAFTFSPVGLVRQRQNGANSPQPKTEAPADASDPDEVVSLFEALPRQLGLRLEMRRRPLPVLVIDGIQRTPTEN